MDDFLGYNFITNALDYEENSTREKKDWEKRWLLRKPQLINSEDYSLGFVFGFDGVIYDNFKLTSSELVELYKGKWVPKKKQHVYLPMFFEYLDKKKDL